MKSLQKSTDKSVEQGRAIARGMNEINIQKQKDTAKAEKRQETMLRKAAEIEIGRNYS